MFHLQDHVQETVADMAYAIQTVSVNAKLVGQVSTALLVLFPILFRTCISCTFCDANYISVGCSCF